MKHIMYIGVAVLLVAMVFVITVTFNFKQDPAEDVDVQINYGDITTVPATTTTMDIWDYVGQQTTVTEETSATATALTDENGAAVTDENGNPLYMIIVTGSEVTAQTTTTETTTKLTLIIQ